LLVLLGFWAPRDDLRGRLLEFWWLQSTPPI
jgi:hypothetical protein